MNMPVDQTLPEKVEEAGAFILDERELAAHAETMADSRAALIRVRMQVNALIAAAQQTRRMDETQTRRRA